MTRKTLIFALLRLFFRTFGRWIPRLGAWAALRLFCTPFPAKLSTPAKAFLDGSRRGSVKLQGLEIETFERGAGPTVLLLHGWNSHAASLRAFAGPLVDRDCRVLAVNLPAHGGSSGARTNMLECSRVIADLIRREAPVKGLITHSFAGPAALLALRDAPDLPVERVVTIGSPIDMDKVFRDYAIRFGLSAAIEMEFRDRIDRFFGEPFLDIDFPAVAASLGDRMLVVHDVEDADVPVVEARALARGEGVESFITEGYGHNRILRRDPVMERVVGFLSAPIS